VSTRAIASLGLVSVVIPVEPGGSALACLRSLEGLPRAEKGLIREVFVAQGRHPSRQRNLAVARAQAPWILFLDSDSRLQPQALGKLLAAGTSLKAVMVGGPNLAPPEEPFWGRVFQRVLGSWLGSMDSRCRYRGVGQTRLATEKELILCNLLAQREAFQGVGGFREDLYPNEENELFNRLQAQGGRLAYEPQAAVLRPRRQSVAAFALQAFRYGRGRAQQMRANFFRSDLVNLLPLGLGLVWAMVCLHPLWLLPLAGALVVLLLLALVGAGSALSELSLYLPMVALRHHAYALGLLVGLLQKAPARPSEVELQRVPWRRV
jgi:succinoglycan biosynthesis protein ExoA